MWPGRLCCFVKINWLGFERGQSIALCYSAVDSHILMRNRLAPYKNVSFPQWSGKLALSKLVQSSKLMSSRLPPPASPGRPGGPPRVVRGQSHAGKLDWRVHRLLLRFQTQGESQLPFPPLTFYSFIILAFFQSLDLFPYQVFPLHSLRFSSLSARALIARLYSGLSEASVYLCISIKKSMYQNMKISTLLFAFSGRIHLRVAIYPNRWCHRLVAIEFSESHIYRSSHVCRLKLSGHKKKKPAAWAPLLNHSPQKNQKNCYSSQRPSF